MQKNIKVFVVKTSIFIIIGLLIALFISVYFRHTEFYKTNLYTPKEFSIEPPNFRTNFISSLFIGFIAFFILTYDRLKNIKEPKTDYKLLIIPFLLLISQYLLKYIIAHNLEFFLKANVFWAIIRAIINIGFIISLAISIYGINFIKYFTKEFKKEIIVFSLISVVFFFILLYFQNLWLVLSNIISKILYLFFKLFFKDVIYKEFVQPIDGGGGPLLGINDFSAIIGKPCSGIDSLLYFSVVFILIVFVDRKRLKPLQTIFSFFLGLIGMFLTNMIRILLLFMIGAYISQEFALGMFHNNIGWILFIIYFYIFYKIARKFMYKK